jgi:hypothetical protein
VETETIRKDDKIREIQVKRKGRLPSRNLIRHVLRARLRASASLVIFLADIQRAGEHGEQVRASEHLARLYPHSQLLSPSHPKSIDQIGKTISNGDGIESKSTYEFLPTKGPTAWRSAKEVIAFLRENGAQIANLESEEEGDWAATSPTPAMSGAESEGELEAVVSP